MMFVRTKHKRLLRGEAALLGTIALRGGIRRPILLPRSRRAFAPALWRRRLLEVWYRQDATTQQLEGPFYALTINGAHIASTFNLSPTH